MILIMQPLKMKNGCKLTKIAFKPYLRRYFCSTKQNDYVRMTFPENSSLQCFRTAPLSMVTPSKESRYPMYFLYFESHWKTIKSHGRRWVKQQRRRRLRKRHLKSEVTSKFIVLFPSRLIHQMLAIFSGVKF